MTQRPRFPLSFPVVFFKRCNLRDLARLPGTGCARTLQADLSPGHFTAIPRGTKFRLTPGPIGPGLRLHRKRKDIEMSKFYNVTTPVEGSDGKTRFHKVGVAFPQGDSAKSVMSIKLFATPANGELVLFAPKSGTEHDPDTE